MVGNGACFNHLVIGQKPKQKKKQKIWYRKNKESIVFQCFV